MIANIGNDDSLDRKLRRSVCVFQDGLLFNQASYMDQDRSGMDQGVHRGILPKFSAVMQTCGDILPKSFAALLTFMFERLNNEILALAENATSDDQRNRYFSALHEIQLRRLDMEQIFYQEIVLGFENFAKGKTTPRRPEVSNVKQVKLSLVEKDEHDKTITINNIVNNACSNFLDRLFALNRRLAVVNGGTKLGEKSAALPAGPRQVCNAFVTATQALDCDTFVIIDLIKLFDKFVIAKSDRIYDDFNFRLSTAGILPNLTNESAFVSDVREQLDQHQAGSPAAPQPPYPGVAESPAVQQLPPQGVPQFRQQESAPQTPYGFGAYTDAAIGQQLYNGITELLARRHQLSMQGPGGPTMPGTQSAMAQGPVSAGTLANLMGELNALQHAAIPSMPTHGGSQYQPTINDIRLAFEEQIAKFAKIAEREELPAAESDVIDLVGMLFEFILDDENMPDSVKALLSHLHTPFLKIAILDRKFFVRNHHPARKLLNAMSQAGSRCDPGDSNDLNVVSKIQSIVNKILNDFDDDVEVFSDLLEQFSLFMDNFNRRSMMMEKRSVEAAKGRDKLQTARRIVSTEIVDRSIEQQIPKVVEDLLLGAWANFLVITYLRHGENSGEWKSAIKLTDELIWSVQPKRNDIERENLRNALPKLVDSVRAGLDLAGDLDTDREIVMERLARCHKLALSSRKKESHPIVAKADETLAVPPEAKGNETLAVPAEPTKVNTAKTRAAKEARWKEIIPKEWRADIEAHGGPHQAEEGGKENKEIVDQLKAVELGTWFEFYKASRKITERGKLAWINQNTSNYMFVNQGGRQVAVRSLYNLAKEIHRGDVKILTIEKAPFISRALNTIHSKLKKTGSNDPAAGRNAR